MGRSVAHVLDHCGSTSAKNAVHLRECRARQGEVFECRLADDQVERVGLERHLRHVALPEIDADPCLPCAVAPDLNERVADVEGGHIKTTKARHLDGQIAGAGRHLQNSRPVRQPGREVGSLGSVSLDLGLRAPHPCVPPRYGSFHFRTFERPSTRFLGLHLRFLLYLTLLGTSCSYNTPNNVRYASPTKRNRGESPN